MSKVEKDERVNLYLEILAALTGAFKFLQKLEICQRFIINLL